MKREDIYTLDEELPKRVKARFVSANDNCYFGIPLCAFSVPEEINLGLLINFDESLSNFSLVVTC